MSSAEETKYLFSYGTLCDPAVQRIILGKEVPMQPATLHGWSLRKGCDGYLFIKPDPDQSVSGKILSLTKDQLHRADQWEEIPLYVREKVSVLANGNQEVAWVYTQREAKGEPFNQIGLSELSRDAVLQAASALSSQVAHVVLPACDIYLLIPCCLVQNHLKKGSNEVVYSDAFLKYMQLTSDVEFSGELARKLERIFLQFIDIVSVAYDNDNQEIEIGRQRARAYLTVHKPTRLGIVIIPLPACSISPHHLLAQMTREDVRVLTTASPTIRKISTWLEDHGLHPVGKSRAAVILSKTPSPEALRRLLAAEADPVDDITSLEVCKEAETDIAQYKYYQMFISETCEVEVVPFSDTYELRIPDATLTIFIMELVLLQEASLTRVNQRVAKEIQSCHYESNDDCLGIIEDLGREFADATLLWDIRNFRYRTAQNLADHFARAFRIEKFRENYNASRQLLEQLIDIHSTRLAEKENKMINKLLVMLAIIQVLPVVYFVAQGLFRMSIALDELMAAIVSLSLCGSLWLIFLSRRNRKNVRMAIRSILHREQDAQ
jgi:gamma-glutamylcyclotransferase (GGCT)/AIG2-like uncharacterized protein YtfP